MIIPQNCSLPCDIVLISGQCVVNESMLTGESFPVIKTPIQKGSTVCYNPIKHKNQTLYGGTEVLQAIKSAQDHQHSSEFGFMNMSIDDRLKSKTTGLVVRIGFQTLKGGLIKEILIRENASLGIVHQAYYFVGCMVLLALIGFLATIPSFINHHYTLEATILRFLDLVSTVVPPALPTVLISGLIYSIDRLRE